MLHGDISNQGAPFVMFEAEGFLLHPEKRDTRFLRLVRAISPKAERWLNPMKWRVDFEAADVVRQTHHDLNIILLTEQDSQSVDQLLNANMVPFQMVITIRTIAELRGLLNCFHPIACYSNLPARKGATVAGVKEYSNAASVASDLASWIRV